jgi:arabinofuranosyltransferase
VLGYRRRWICDDALIITRAVREIVAGNAPIISVGERAEASTSVLWQWLLAFFDFITPFQPDRLAIGLGLLLSIAGIAIAIITTSRLFQSSSEKPVAMIPAGLLVILALPPFWNYLTSGLETGLETFWIATVWHLFVRSFLGQLRRVAGASVVIGLGSLIRPDLGLVSVAFLFGIWFMVRPTPKQLVGSVIAAAMLPFAYEIFRAGYYGILLPLPALTKEASASDWHRGLVYAKDFFVSYWLAGPVAILGIDLCLRLFARRRAGIRPILVIALPVLTSVLMVLYVVKIGGDFMHARMLLPAVWVCLLPFLVLPASKVNAATVVALAVWVGLALSPLRSPYEGGNDIATANVRLNDRALTKQKTPTTGRQWLAGQPDLQAAVDQAEHSKQPMFVYWGGDSTYHLMPMDPRRGQMAAVAGYLGTVGYAVPLNQRIVDQWSLAYPFGAHFQLQRATWPGHEKHVDNVWVFADLADPSAPLPPPQIAGFDSAALAAARHTYSCGEVKEMFGSTRGKLTFTRFEKNLKGSVRRTTFRIPRDPFVAEREICKD